MSDARHSPAVQLRYMLQWFEEWSELQRQDFLPLLADKLSRVPTPEGLADSMAAVNCSDKPMSLFQCRIKLFNEWYPTWGSDERARLTQGCSNIDPGFGDKLRALLDAPPVTNGLNGHSDEEVPEDVKTEDNLPEESEERSPEPEASPERPIGEEVRDTVQESALPLEIAATS